MEFQASYSSKTYGEAFKHVFVTGLVTDYAGEGNNSLCSPEFDAYRHKGKKFIDALNREEWDRFGSSEVNQKWLEWADFNIWPNIARFTSLDDIGLIVPKLLNDVRGQQARSERMKKVNEEIEKRSVAVMTQRIAAAARYNKARRIQAFQKKAASKEKALRIIRSAADKNVGSTEGL